MLMWDNLINYLNPEPCFTTLGPTEVKKNIPDYFPQSIMA